MKPIAECIEEIECMEFARTDDGLEIKEAVLHHLRRLAEADQFTTRHLLIAAEAGLSHMRSRNDPAALLATNAVADLRAFLAAPAASERTCETCRWNGGVVCNSNSDATCGEEGNNYEARR